MAGICSRRRSAGSAWSICRGPPAVWQLERCRLPDVGPFDDRRVTALASRLTGAWMGRWSARRIARTPPWARHALRRNQLIVIGLGQHDRCRCRRQYGGASTRPAFSAVQIGKPKRGIGTPRLTQLAYLSRYARPMVVGSRHAAIKAIPMAWQRWRI